MQNGTANKFHPLNRTKSEMVERFITAIEEHRSKDAIQMIKDGDLILTDRDFREMERNVIQSYRDKAQLFETVKEERDTLLQGIAGVWGGMGGIIQLVAFNKDAPVQKNAKIITTILKLLKAAKLIGGEVNIDDKTASMILNVISFAKNNAEILQKNGAIAFEHLKPSYPILKKYSIIPPDLVAMMEPPEAETVTDDTLPEVS